MHVENYDLFIDLDFRKLRFEGRVVVELESEGDVVLDSVGLTISDLKANGKPAAFQLDSERLTAKTGHFGGKLEIMYAGSIPDVLVGIYRAPYDSTYMITTQFEADHARQMLPCVDNPNYKAEFKLTLRIDADLDAISNMPVETITTEGPKKIVSFQKTPRMSTYLLYLGVGKFEEVKERLDNIDILVATTPGKARKGEFALLVARKSIEFYQSYFGIPYALPKVHLVSVPEFSAGAMENWGAITFRETALEIDKNSSIRTRKRVTEIVAHELAHQWFGNLVTMKWWNDLWLNESFATFMGYKVMDKIFPEWKAWQSFLTTEASESMARDSLKNTHPIEADVKSPSEIAQIFDEISYGKGACILRMIEAYIGAEGFRKGISNYLIRNKFSNATGNDLWDSLEESSRKQVKTIMSQWIRKPGYPMITVSKDGDKLKLKQERFLLSGVFEKGIWPVPIVIKLRGQSKRLLLDSEEDVVEIGDADSLKLNVDQVGFYRVHYQGLYDSVWKEDLSAIDRWGIVFDALAFLVSGKMPFNDYMNLVKKYYNEHDYAPALEVSDQLTFLNLIMPSRVAETSRAYHKSQLGILEGIDDAVSSMLRGVMARRLSVVDENYAKELGAKFHDYENVQPDMKEAIAVAYARAYNNFEELIDWYKKSDSDEERIRLLNAMMNLREKSLITRSLDFTLSGQVKKQDVSSAVLASVANPEARDATWLWIKANIGILRKLHEGTANLSRVFLSIIPILGIGRVEEVERFFTENETPEAKKGIEAGLEKLKIYDRLVRNI